MLNRQIERTVGYSQVARDWTRPTHLRPKVSTTTMSTSVTSPLMERWLNEGMREQPYNNIGEVVIITNRTTGA